MRTRTRDPLAEDRIERLLNRYGLARILATGTGLIVAFVIAAVLALVALGAGTVAVEAIDPGAPGRILDFVAGDPHPAKTVGVATAAEQVPTTAGQATGAAAPSVPASAPATTRAAAPSVRAAAGHTPAAPPGRPQASILTPPAAPSTVAPAPATGQPAPAPTAASVPAPAAATQPSAPAAARPPVPAPTTSTAPAPVPSQSDTGGWDPSDGNGKGNGGCPPGQHKKGKC